ncbi:stemmadenine O-acetyltransferase-like [Beta vulgaris subsp. vulgaris]|uniref:stemmadenine O-acetyltransferase-like n=1 Tax=Beta vulgaris subsp. vulgaris TaxID=3555 RepID=UPI002036F897|nr:stemmadenine O-acetyltransferase-like [Beta vulgaris subsp. vulgaris]
MSVHLTIQINVFTCGGVAIGWYDIHKVTDGTSSATFFKYWAALTRGDFIENIVQPDFEAAITAFPPRRNPELLQMGMANNNGCKNHIHGSPSVVVKSYIFRSNAIAKLKARASSQQVPNPTRLQAMAGFVWEQLLVVSEMAGDQYEHTDTTLQITVNMRPFMNPPLPRGSIGNLIDTAVARAGILASLPELVAEIHGAVLTTKDEIREKYHGENGVEAVRESWDKLIPMLSEYKERAYKIVSWCKLGFSDLDFGFGKPKWMVPTDAVMSSFHKNLIILTDFTDSDGDDGVQAWIFLDEKDIKSLESNSDFLAFASPLQPIL